MIPSDEAMWSGWEWVYPGLADVGLGYPMFHAHSLIGSGLPVTAVMELFIYYEFFS